MPSKIQINYTKALVICHGKSELELVRYIRSNLHLTIKPFSKNGGRNSIQINGLKDYLRKKPFDTIKSFADEFDIEVKGRGQNKKLLNFKLFMIMDTDDCEQCQKEKFINKEMFKSSWLYEYIQPIYCCENFEDVLYDSGLINNRPQKKDKAKIYAKIFPINKEQKSCDSVNEIKVLNEKLKASSKTNMEIFLEYCLANLQEF